MFVVATATMLAITAGSARLSAQCFNSAQSVASNCARPSPADKPAVVTDDAQNLHVFVKGTDNALWHRVRAGADAASPWGAWQSLGGTLLSGPAASLRPGTTTVDVFVRSTSNHLAHKWLSGTSWSAWEDLGGNIDSDPASVSWAANRVDVFARNATTKSLDHVMWPVNGVWSTWESLGGGLSGGPAVVSRAPNSLDVMVAGVDSYMYHKSWNGTAWSEYDSQGCCIIGTPAAFTARPGSFMVAALGTDSRIFLQTYAENGWSGWKFEMSQWHATSSPAFAYHSPNPSPELVAMVSGGNMLMRLAADNTGNWGLWQPLMTGGYLDRIAVTSNADFATAINGCPSGTAPTGQDLNEGAGGDYIFLCLSWNSSPGIRNIGIQVAAEEKQSAVNCPAGYTVLPYDLNKGAGGKTLFLCLGGLSSAAGQLPLTNITFRTTTGFAATGSIFGVDPLSCNQGEAVKYGADPKNLGNFNAGAVKGKYIIACMIRATR